MAKVRQILNAGDYKNFKLNSVKLRVVRIIFYSSRSMVNRNTHVTLYIIECIINTISLTFKLFLMRSVQFLTSK